MDNTITQKKGYWFLIYAFVIYFSFSACKPNANNLNKFSWTQTNNSLTLYNHNVIVWQYNFNTKKGKPYFHPINIGKTTLTAHAPNDHPWHLGLWFSWKYINEVNYWEYDTGNNSEKEVYGSIKFNSIEIDKHSDFSCDIKANISYYENGSSEILNEAYTIHISTPDRACNYHMDYKVVSTPTKDNIELNRTPLPNEPNGKSWGGYAGLSIRFNTQLQKTSMINEDGSNELKHGHSYNWMYYGLKNNTNNHVGVAFFDNKQNFNNPTYWHVTNDLEKSYNLNFIQPAAIFKEPYTIKQKDSLVLSYRVSFYKNETTFDAVKKDWLTFQSLKK